MTAPRLAVVQGLRGVAVLLVMAYHSQLPIPGGFLGVDVFFVISGFVILRMLLNEWDAKGTISFRQFYLRRFSRLAPGLSLMVLVTMVLSLFFLSPFRTQEATFATGIGSLFGVANLIIPIHTGGYFDVRAEASPLIHTWSLSVEEQFYLVFPIGLLLLLRISRGRKTSWLLFGVISGVASVSFLLALLGATESFSLGFFNSQFNFYSPATRAWEFLSGALVALVFYQKGRLGNSPTIAWLSASILLFGVFLYRSEFPVPGLWTVLPVAGTAGIILFASAENSALGRLLSRKFLVAVGNYSYSLYLWHWPFAVFFPIAFPGVIFAPLIGVCCSVVVAIVAYRYVENPLRQVPQSE